MTTREEDSVDCERLLDEDVAVRYLSGKLTEEEQAAFEQHYFNCVVCFERLQVLEAAQAAARNVREIGARQGAAHRRRPAAVFLPLAAGVAFVAVAAGLLLREIGPGRLSPSPAPSTSPAAGPSPRAPGRSIEELARFDPPRYTPILVRGDADAAFQQAMNQYARREYARALPDLRRAARLEAGRADILFYLGVSELLAGEVDAGVDDLRRSVDLGLPGYSEPARFYLAMGYLRRGDTARARAELEIVSRSNTLQATEARQRLAALDESRPAR
jgi:tetratricopeptide (TPR) repeat protein